MLITNHVLSGTVVGLISRSPQAALGWGVLSHFGLDAVPHYGVEDEHFFRLAVRDGLIGLAAIAAVAAAVPADRRTRVLAGITGACLPDMDKVGREFFGRSPFPEPFDRLHASIQRESRRHWPVEMAAAVLSLLGSRTLLRR